MAYTASSTNPMKVAPRNSPIPTTRKTETLAKLGTLAELNKTNPPAMNEAVPTTVKAPWVGALISKMYNTKAMTGNNPSP